MRSHKNTSIEELIRQMLHSQHKASTNQSDGDTVEEWKSEILSRIESMKEIARDTIRFFDNHCLDSEEYLEEVTNIRKKVDSISKDL
jgi:two-component sensor histidine kinase